jgi:hypothetical protein
MYRKEVNDRSPLRILEASIHGGLGKGNLGVVMARAGVGKTACLVQIGLDDLLRERPVMHVALEQTVDHVISWYDALFEDMLVRNDLDDPDSVHDMVQRNRVIQAFADHDLWPERLEKTVEMFREHVDFKPAAILVDGYNWESHTVAENAAMIGAFKAYAKMLDAELWMSAQTHRAGTGDHPSGLTPPWDQYANLIDVAIFLEPHGDTVSVRLLKDHEDAEPPDTHLNLHSDTLSLMVEDAAEIAKLPTEAFTLLSGAANGAEKVFGECAEEWGMMELNFSFPGRKTARNRGLVELTAAELEQGHVSRVYVKAHLHREFPRTPHFEKMLQTIWHQVNTSGQVFVIGTVLDDQTIKGGTGWAAELARHWGKPAFVFDQGEEQWRHWDGESWAKCEPPRINARRFTGSGTRKLNDAGAKAIRELFERSFGPR